ncbi:sulfotransferase [Lysobacter sp. SG-8]|uniref:Sulfotransferase n=1 Tax=Marilutibacter penaei TaxID=2759900 RepID=A0A7W3U3D7_9GAMM|nr:sulfotransferase [Lysobacter penaei]MBB1088204.1 sulfotransferase [Lysobacter penaei]
MSVIDIHGHPLDASLGPRWQRSVALAQQGDLAGASGEMEALLSAHPGFAPGILQLAQFRLARGHYRQAMETAAALMDAPLPTLEFAWHAVRLLRRFELHEAVARVAGRAPWPHSSDARLLHAVASELVPIGLYDLARPLLERAGRLAPRVAPLQVTRGTLDFVSGDLEASRQRLRAAASVPGPHVAHALWLLSMQPEDDRIDSDLEATAAALRSVPDGSGDAAYLAFAMHNLHHAAGQYEAAWQALAQGCAIKQRTSDHDPVAQARLFDALGSMHVSGVATPVPVDASVRPVFIVGMYRSGTSVLERVLSGHPDVADGGESQVMPAALRLAFDRPARSTVDLSMVVEADRVDLAPAASFFRRHARWKAGGRAVFTEKLPENFLLAGFILAAMPEARILHMQRDPMDTCFSNLRTFFSGAAPYSYDQATLADYYSGYRRLMDHWRALYPERILDVDYQRFVDDPGPETERVLAFCGLDYRPHLLDVGRQGGYSATASIGSVRAGIQRNRGGAWRPYAAHLAPLREALGHLSGPW